MGKTYAIVGPEPRVHTAGAASVRKRVKFSVVPEPSARCATVIGRFGSETPEFSCLIAGESHVVISPSKISAIVSGDSCKSLTPGTL